MNLKFLAKHSSLLYSLNFYLKKIRRYETTDQLDAAFSKIVTGPSPTKEALDQLSKIYYRDKTIFDGLGKDPFSPRFSRGQWELYHRLSGRSTYGLENEATPIDFEEIKNDFFPYNTASPELVGASLLTQGFLIQNLRLPPRARVVEFGAGWGNTAIPLAMMHYNVTAVEANPPSAELILHRSRRVARNVEIVSMDMLEFAKSAPGKFDAVIFSASFHHCSNHQEMLAALPKILNPGGALYFSDEPIFYASNPMLPYPWGLRLDGQSLYFIRTHGWLELGFQYSYLRKILAMNGFRARIVHSYFQKVPNLIVADYEP